MACSVSSTPPSSPLPPLQQQQKQQKQHIIIADNKKYSGLDFTATALRANVAVATEELSTSFRNAYGTTLKKHHSFLVKPIFSAAMSATPYRKDFYAKLGQDRGKVEHELRVWLLALEKQVAILKGFQDRKEAKW